MRGVVEKMWTLGGISDSILVECRNNLKTMNFTMLPSFKGQITIPALLREKYKIGKDTPIVIQDNDNGTMTIKIMKMVDQDDVVYREDEGGVGLSFKKGIDPRVLIKAIKDIDG